MAEPSRPGYCQQRRRRTSPAPTRRDTIPMRLHPSAVFIPLATVLVLSHDAQAQCSAPWVPSIGAGPNGPVFASHAFDPDGPGPAHPQALVGGFFGLGPSGPLTNVALYDPIVNSWSALGAGVDSTVIAVLRLVTGTSSPAAD